MWKTFMWSAGDLDFSCEEYWRIVVSLELILYIHLIYMGSWPPVEVSWVWWIFLSHLSELWEFFSCLHFKSFEQRTYLAACGGQLRTITEMFYFVWCFGADGLCWAIALCFLHQLTVSAEPLHPFNLVFTPKGKNCLITWPHSLPPQISVT